MIFQNFYPCSVTERIVSGRSRNCQFLFNNAFQNFAKFQSHSKHWENCITFSKGDTGAKQKRSYICFAKTQYHSLPH